MLKRPIKLSLKSLINSVLLFFLISLRFEQFCLAEPSMISERGGGIVGSVEGELVTNGQWLRVSSETPRKSQSLSPVWGSRFALDYPLNHYLWLGGELALMWLSEPLLIEWQNQIARAELGGGRRLTATPSARVRLDFPLACRWYLEGLFAGGVTRWGENRDSEIGAEDEVRWGLAWRIGIGLRYAINTQVQGVLNVAYAEQNTWSHDEITLSAYPISLGLRGGF